MVMTTDEAIEHLRSEGYRVEPPVRRESEETRLACAAEMTRRRNREQQEATLARQDGKSRTYIDNDGCEVTVTPEGHTFYNTADWY